MDLAQQINGDVMKTRDDKGVVASTSRGLSSEGASNGVCRGSDGEVFGVLGGDFEKKEDDLGKFFFDPKQMPIWFDTAADEAKRVYLEHLHIIRQACSWDDRILKFYNLPLIDGNLSFDELRDFLLIILNHQLKVLDQSSYKIKLSFGFILYNQIEEDYIYYYPNISNAQITEHEVGEFALIEKVEDMIQYIEFLKEQNILETLVFKRPSTKYTLFQVTNVNVHLFCLPKFRLGVGKKLAVSKFVLQEADLSGSDEGEEGLSEGESDFSDGYISDLVCSVSDENGEQNIGADYHRFEMEIDADEYGGGVGGEGEREDEMTDEDEEVEYESEEDEERLERQVSLQSQGEMDPDLEEDDGKQASEFGVKVRNVTHDNVPAFIRNSDHILTLLKDPRTGDKIEDYLCVFRCIAMVKLMYEDIDAGKINTKKGFSYSRYWKKYFTRIEKKTEDLFVMWSLYTGKEDMTKINFRGLDVVKECPYLESLFEIRINVFKQHKKTVHDVMYMGCFDGRKECNILAFMDHSCLITQKNLHLGKYRCIFCNRLSPTFNRWKNHQRKCVNTVNRKFPQKQYIVKPTLWETLALYGIDVKALMGDSMYSKYLVTYDFETYTKKIHCPEGDESRKLRYICQQEILSCVVASNVPSYTDPKFIVQSEEQIDIVKEMLRYMYEIQNVAADLNYLNFLGLRFFLYKRLIELRKHIEERYRQDEEFKYLCKEHEVYNMVEDNFYCGDEEKWTCEQEEILRKIKLSNLGRINFAQFDDGQCQKMEELLLNLWDQLWKFCTVQVVIGFNSQRFDLYLARAGLVKYMGLCHHGKYDNEEEVRAEVLEFDTLKPKYNSVIKKGSSYMVLANSRISFVDCCNFVGNIPLRTFILSQGQPGETKLWFPYEKMQDLKVLGDPITSLRYEDFYSTLKQQNTLDSEYLEAYAAGKTEEELGKIERGQEKFEKLMKYLRDRNVTDILGFLTIYNVHDCIPFLHACENLVKNFRSFDIDLFKQFVSLAGASRFLLDRYSPNNPKVSLLTEEEFRIFRKSVSGGLSCVFLRFSKAGFTKIPGSEELVKKIMGFDISGLYSKALRGDIPVGAPIVRKYPNFEAQYRDYYKRQDYWLDFLEQKFHISIERQRHIMPYVCDGFRNCDDGTGGKKGIVYEYNGCMVHGHSLCSRIESYRKRIQGEDNLKNFDKTMEKRRQHYEKKKKYLLSLNYEVVELWECHFDFFKLDLSFRDFMQQQHRSCFDQLKGKKRNVTEEEIINAVKDGSLKGFVQVDVEFSEDLREKYDRFPLIIGNTWIRSEHWGDFMRDYCEKNGLPLDSKRLLVSGHAARKMLFSCEYLQFLLEMGACVTRVYRVLEFQMETIFRNYIDKMVDGRNEADERVKMATDPIEKAAIKSMGNTFKGLCNMAYGSMLISVTDHRNVSFTDNTSVISMYINSPRFKGLRKISSDIYEVSALRRTYKIEHPAHIGVTVLQAAKVHMLRLYYRLFYDTLDPRKYYLAYCDTDSYYVCTSENSLFECVAEGKQNLFRIRANEYVVLYEDQLRIPGLLHTEFIGDTIICCAPKTYIAFTMKRVDGYILIRAIRGSEYYIGEDKQDCSDKGKDSEDKHDCSDKGGDEESRRESIVVEGMRGYTADRAYPIKSGAKGVVKNVLMKDPVRPFVHVFEYKEAYQVENRGFRVPLGNHGIIEGIHVDDPGKLCLYVQLKEGFAFFYCKRQVAWDNISTRALPVVISPEGCKPINRRLKGKFACLNNIETEGNFLFKNNSDVDFHAC